MRRLTWADYDRRNKLMAQWPADRDAPSSPRPSFWTQLRDALLADRHNPAIRCPFCEAVGTVRTRRVRVRAGIHGGKATAALFTGGLSLLLTGLSRMEEKTELHCDNCGMTWRA